MAKTKIAYQEVANKINQWYTMIKKREIENAVKIKEEINNMLEDMEENQNLLLYYNLLDSRHKLLLDMFKSSGSILEKIQKSPEMQKTDDMLQYYFLFFSGQYMFSKKKYIEAINYYKLAEDKLVKIEDEIEKAEFYYHLAISYYHIDQYFFSLAYAEKALAVFREYDDYAHRTVSSEMILGANKLDLFRYEAAYKHYEHALNIAKTVGIPNSVGKVYHNLGIFYIRRNMLSEAEDCFKNALLIDEYAHTYNGLKAIYNLTHVLYKSGHIEEAREWLKKGLNRAEKEGDKEYLAKFTLVNTLYDEYNESVLADSLDTLEQMGLWNDVAELTLEVGCYFKKSDDITNTAKFLEKCIHARDQILKMTEELK
ncbi:tetratricopeptide repeat protein [Bacillus sonorensis]|uniref:Response regulator n=3 Tax=Bacillus sonorensis TaxID=119858 RepID=M5P841_9BACI|nr:MULTISPECIES: Rap family tetratricopeptide repeat protein [Bacillus]TWK84195.1 Response regulator aspartate phosphatase I [Bacillus paralicheniformis]ASB89178.1 Response regulator aspartate phosphatase [Bacillus sonorensis]EME75599.1 response regulator [Bacillus sonorensis L12]MCF7618514.1 tetratricopeptide repeat protein [Bacillus sonorensis]MCY8026839.1 tetratricopeptide repeat protein [Bacillus sonorensis]